MPQTLLVNFDVSSKSFINQISTAIGTKWSRAIKLAAPFIDDKLKYQLIFGGRRINGFVQTSVYDWITSDTGIGQLGLTSRGLIDNLLEGIIKSTGVQVVGKELIIRVFHVETIARATPHPKTNSWFVDWIYNEKAVTDARFVQVTEGRITTGIGTRTYFPRSFPVVGPKSGWMLKIEPKLWAVPPYLRQSIDSWLARNINGIQSLVIEEIGNAIKRI